MIAKAKVLDSVAKTPSVHHIRVEKPAGFDFRPVQFCGLELLTEDGSEEYSMSIASSPTRPYIEFGARLSGSPWKRAFQALRPGDEVEIDGPYGHFILDEARPAVLLAGGIGITPLKGMIEYATDRRLAHPLELVYSSRDATEVAYAAELEDLAERNPRLRITHTLTREPPGSPWTGRRGRIDADLLTQLVTTHPEAAFYVCGLPEMVKDVVLGLRSLGVPKERALYEQFWGYA